LEGLDFSGKPENDLAGACQFDDDPNQLSDVMRRSTSREPESSVAGFELRHDAAPLQSTALEPKAAYAPVCGLPALVAALERQTIEQPPANREANAGPIASRN
jgi:hypothetical protein